MEERKEKKRERRKLPFCLPPGRNEKTITLRVDPDRASSSLPAGSRRMRELAACRAGWVIAHALNETDSEAT